MPPNLHFSKPPERGAGCPACCVAIRGDVSGYGRNVETTLDTAGWTACATSAAKLLILGSIAMLCATIALGQGASGQSVRAALDQYCTGCHNQKLKTAGLMLDTLDPSHAGTKA